MLTIKHKLLVLSQCLSVFLSVPLFAQDLTPKAPPQAKPVAIINAMVHPVSGPVIESGFVFFDQGVIVGIGPVGSMDASKIADPGWIIIDAKGKHVYPGLIAPYTHLGLTEIAAVRATLDMAEVGPATPEVRGCVAVNPDSTLLPVTRSNGVLVAGVFPQSGSGPTAYFDSPGGLMPGRASVMRLDGWTTEDMTILDDAGLAINWPQGRPIAAWWMDKSEAEQQKQIDRSRKVIEDMVSGAKAYWTAKGAGPAAAADGKGRDIRYEAMRLIYGDLPGGLLPAGTGWKGTLASVQRPVFILANDYDQISQALSFCEAHKLKCVIVGGADAPLCADAIKRAGASVIVLGTTRFPKRDDSAYDDGYTLGARLEAAGVPWCMASGDETPHERNLPYAAAMAAAYGLDHEAALRSITINAATMLGIAQRYGSLETGKSATLIVADGDILEVATHVEKAFIDGRAIDLADKQKTLAEKYREKYKQQGTK